MAASAGNIAVRGTYCKAAVARGACSLWHDAGAR